MSETSPGLETRTLQISLDHVQLEGTLTVPDDPRGVVIFTNCRGTSRLDLSTQHLVKEVRKKTFTSLVVDLLTFEEENLDRKSCQFSFDSDLLAQRATGVIDWLAGQPFTRGMPIGLYGDSSGSIGALMAAANRPDPVRAVVTQSGRPDLAGPLLPLVQAPTLMIVGSLDHAAIEINQQGLERMSPDGAPKKMVIVPGATYRFEEAGTLDQAARLAREWFQMYFQETPPADTRYLEV